MSIKVFVGRGCGGAKDKKEMSKGGHPKNRSYIRTEKLCPSKKSENLEGKKGIMGTTKEYDGERGTHGVTGK